MRPAGQEAFNEILRDDMYYTTLSKEALLLTDVLLRNDQSWEGELRR